jgi:hypothetical protein
VGMTEAEWLSCESQHTLLTYVRGRASDRKARLFACAVVRREWQWLIRKWNQRAVEVAEELADGLATRAEMKKAAGRAFDNYEAWGERFDSLRNANITYAFQKSMWVDNDDAWKAADYVSAPAQSPWECELIRCVFGNPFRPVTLAPVPVSSTITSLAEAAYEQRNLPSGHLDPARLAILADALEEAGCTDEAILSHLRSVGPHVRGCWALDLVLGRS